MNERDVPQFDLQGVKSILVRFNKDCTIPVSDLPPFTQWPISIERIVNLAKRIIEYAALCGVIPPRSTMK